MPTEPQLERFGRGAGPPHGLRRRRADGATLEVAVGWPERDDIQVTASATGLGTAG
jgi:hypothetical protein